MKSRSSMLSIRAQASFEYIILVGIMLALVVPVFYYAVTASSENIKQRQAEDVVESLKKAADEVYALGPGTRRFVLVSMPGTVDNLTINENELTLKLTTFGEPSEIVAFTKAQLTGDIPIVRGSYQIKVEHLDSGVVLIGTGDDTDTPQITWSFPSSLACNPITLRATTNEPTQCRYDTVDTSYATMATLMSGSALGHSAELGVQAESGYTYYVRCSDAFGNTMSSSEVISYQINFTYCGGAGNLANETDPPIVTLISPASGYTSDSSQIIFSYNVTDESPIFSCTLLADGAANAQVDQPGRNTPNNITGNLDAGTYDWSVSCTDAFGAVGNSTTREIVVTATLDDDFPVVNLGPPINGSSRNFNLVKFFYNVSDETSDISSCTLSLSGKLDSGGVSSQAVSDYSISENSSELISLSLEQGNHTWNISCKDNSIYLNEGFSQTRWLRINSTSEESYIISCAGQCGFEGYSNGICRQSPSKCTQNGETHSSTGDQYCTGGAQSNTCCCVP
ncbi:MAG TPA: hypothetical protein VJH88_00725 [Candidatus Nanoarchaeia archaeon]|nr:hypothetical protein [Candidatus Nanoarchaeia archaeon]